MSIELGNEVGDAARLLRNMPRACATGGAPLVEFHADLAKRLERVERILKGTPKAARSPRATEPPETRFSTGTIAHKGRLVRVEKRRRG